ncbi:MAG: hypothetical protein JNK22_15005 [Rhodocyclaceae bacterium]|nr:hypothetical protein [Rhodocyclaceae bacterium]
MAHRKRPQSAAADFTIGPLLDPRESAPQAILATARFAWLCPASAAFMAKALGTEGSP